jgi:hypothetical protein
MGERHLRLNDDGTISLRWGNTTIELREPTMEETTVIVSRVERLDAAYVKARTPDVSSASLLLGNPGGISEDEPDGFYGAFAAMVNTLKPSDTPDIEAATLPTWAGNRTLWGELINHWLTVPLARGETDSTPLP